jgi:3-oxoacyl-[acyl-carrier protein] reductase
MPHSGRVALVTGASRGIGAGIARRLARDGLTVLVGHRVRTDQAAEVVAQIAAAGGAAEAVAVDTADPASVTACFAGIDERFGRLDVVVNNAGVAVMGPLVDADEAQLHAVLQVNLAGVVRVSREAARRLGAGGRIIAISSLNGRIASPGGSLYAASKAAVESLTRSWALELGPRGVTVNAVAPGWTESDMLDVALPAEVRPQAIAQTALRRIGTPDDIADVVAFLASDAARWVTGQIIGADGGIFAW